MKRKETLTFEELLREREFHGETMELAVHDLKSPASFLANSGYLLEDYLKAVENVNTPQEKAKAIFNLRRQIRRIESKARRIANSADMLLLSNITPEEINKMRQKFKVFEVVEDSVISYEHEMISDRQLGFDLTYSSSAHSLQLYTNQGVLSSIFANLVGNAVKYAYQASVVKSLLFADKDNLVFELENMVEKMIDDAELTHIFEKGYRIKSNSGEVKELSGTNQGLGLYFVNRIVKQGYGGEVRVKSSDSFQITDERAKGLTQRNYAAPYTPSYIPFPSFHISISFPLENITEPKEENDPDGEFDISKI